MNKKMVLLVTGILFLSLAGCSSLMPTLAVPPDQPGQGTNATPVPANANSNSVNATPDPAMTLEFRLAPGTLKLEGTAHAVTSDEARQLLPLWQKVKTLSADSNTTQSDLQTVYKQIQDAMTSSQIQTIEQMSLNQSDIQALAQTYNIQMPQGGSFNGGGFPTLSPEERATRAAIRTLTPGAGANRTGGQNNTGGGQGGNGFRGGRGFGFNQLFIDPLIQLLQQRAGG